MSYKAIGVSAIALLGLSACSATNIDSAMETPPASEVALYKYKAQVNKEQVTYIPDWYLEPPQKEGSVYAVGTSVTPDLQLATDLAILNAKVTLADRFQSNLKSQTKNFLAKVGATETDMSVINEVERVTKNLIANTDVSGYHMVHNKVVAHGPMFRSFVLLEYNDEAANTILLNRLKKDRLLLNRLQANNAYKELENAVEKHEDKKNAERQKLVDSISSSR